MTSIYDAVSKQLLKKIKKKSVRKKIVEEVITPIIEETKNKYYTSIKFTQFFIGALFILLILNLYFTYEIHTQLSP